VLFVGGTAYDMINIEVRPKSSTQDQYQVEIDTRNGVKFSKFDASRVAPGPIAKVVGIGNGTNDLITVVCGSVSPPGCSAVMGTTPSRGATAPTCSSAAAVSTCSSAAAVAAC
jgi:hypothetical protein